MNRPTAPRPSLLPAVIGFALAGILILVLGLWVANRKPPSEPLLELVQPAHDTAIAGAVRVVFRSSLPLRLQPTGWGSGRFHPHILAGGQEIMAAATTIKPLGDDLYEWVLPPVTQPTDLQVLWALPNHQRLPEGAS